MNPNSEYSIDRDLEKWKAYAKEIHSRNIVKSGSDETFYTFAQSSAERGSHSWIANLPLNRDKVLEIGAGGGEHIEFEKGKMNLKNYTALDIDKNFLNIISQRYPDVDLVESKADKTPFEDSTFTTIIAHGVLEHISSLDSTLQEVSRILKDDGKFVVLVPANGNFTINLFKLLVTYPSLKIRGIKRPSYIWHFENANSLTRIQVYLEKNFLIEKTVSLPFKALPRFLSPLIGYVCSKK